MIYEVRRYIKRAIVDGKLQQMSLDELSGEDTIYIANFTVITQRGPMPMSKEIEAESVEEAFELFVETAEAAAREQERKIICI